MTDQHPTVPSWTPQPPPARRPGLAPGLVAGLIAVLLLFGGVGLYAARQTAATAQGASSPEAAAAGLLTALGSQDFARAAGYLDGEEAMLVDTYRDRATALLEGRMTGPTGQPLSETRISQVMSKDLVTVGPQTSLREAAKIMADRWIRHLPVVDGGRLVGVISQRDLAGVLAGALNEPEALTALVEASELVRERRLRRVEHGVWD